MQMTAWIRPFRPGIAGETAGDAAALSDICARTAANGQDARGVLSDDRVSCGGNWPTFGSAKCCAHRRQTLEGYGPWRREPFPAVQLAAGRVARSVA